MVDLKVLLTQMTVEEKIGQLTQYNGNLFIESDVDVTGPMTSLGLKEEDLKTVGSVLNFKNVEEVIEIQRKHLEQDRNKIPMTFMMDVVHGYKTIFPIPLGLGASFDTEIVEECTKMAANEAAASGVQVTFTPMVDYVRDARWGRVMETCGEEPMINSIMGATQVKAFQGGDISSPHSLATCVKHFAAYGGAEAGRDYNTVELSEHTLREFYLPAYKACIDAGVDMLMPSFNVLNGVPAVANKWLMKNILKDEWNADVLVISDYNAVGELLNHGVVKDKKEAAKIAFENGCHIEMCSAGYINHLKELIDEGVFTMQQLDEAVMKVLKFKEKLGLFEDPFHGASAEREKTELVTEENRRIVRKAAAESAVLLKNDDVLPMSEDIKKIALIGPFINSHEILGNWACRGEFKDAVSVYDGIKNAIPGAEIVTAYGCSCLYNQLDKSGFAEAVEAAKGADAVILCLGEHYLYSGEGNSRADIDLPGVQNELAEEIAKVNKNTVAVLFTGRPLALKRLSNAVPAILNMWFPGTEGGNAVCDLLFGKVNPSGKLTMSFPKAVGQCPIYYNHLNTGRPKVTEDDVHVGFRSNYVDCGNMPLYPFGYGLSYSNFVYENMTLSKNRFAEREEVTVEITIHNDSRVRGKETVMLYMRDLVASNSRPVQQLIAFEKVQFEPGERKTVEFKIREEMLRFWNNEQKFVSEAGEFHISTGYADNLLFTTSLFLDK